MWNGGFDEGEDDDGDQDINPPSHCGYYKERSGVRQGNPPRFPRAIIEGKSPIMNRNFWRDLYPVSETRRRLARSSWVWIYLPIAAGFLIAACLAAILLGSGPGDGYLQTGQVATIILAGGMLAVGFLGWLVILAALWALGDLMQLLPMLTTRMRVRFVNDARLLKRNIHTVKHTAAAVSRFFSRNKHAGAARWTPPVRGSVGREKRDG
jgi:hypothetical protein